MFQSHLDPNVNDVINMLGPLFNQCCTHTWPLILPTLQSCIPRAAHVQVNFEEFVKYIKIEMGPNSDRYFSLNAYIDTRILCYHYFVMWSRKTKCSSHTKTPMWTTLQTCLDPFLINVTLIDGLLYNITNVAIMHSRQCYFYCNHIWTTYKRTAYMVGSRFQTRIYGSPDKETSQIRGLPTL